jgi:hypothetical protein
VPLALHLGREADHSPPSSADIKEWVELYLHSPNTPSWRGAQLGRTRGDNFKLMHLLISAAACGLYFHSHSLRQSVVL